MLLFLFHICYMQQVVHVAYTCLYVFYRWNQHWLAYTAPLTNSWYCMIHMQHSMFILCRTLCFVDAAGDAKVFRLCLAFYHKQTPHSHENMLPHATTDLT